MVHVYCISQNWRFKAVWQIGHSNGLTGKESFLRETEERVFLQEAEEQDFWGMEMPKILAIYLGWFALKDEVEG